MKKVRAGAHTWALLIVVFLAVGVGSASSSSGLPSIKIGKHVCTSSLSRWGNCGAVVLASSSGTPLAGTTPPAAALGPAQFHSAYNLPTTAPAAYDDRDRRRLRRPEHRVGPGGYDPYYGLPACTTANGCFRKVNQTGGTAYPTDGRRLVARDRPRRRDGTRRSARTARSCSSRPASATTANLGAAENEAVALGANVISNSWLSGEYSSETADECHTSTTRASRSPRRRATTATASASRRRRATSRRSAARRSTLGSSGCVLRRVRLERAAAPAVRAYDPEACLADRHRLFTPVGRRRVGRRRPEHRRGGLRLRSYSGQTGWFQVGGTSLASPLDRRGVRAGREHGARQRRLRIYAHSRARCTT